MAVSCQNWHAFILAGSRFERNFIKFQRLKTTNPKLQCHIELEKDANDDNDKNVLDTQRTHF